MDQASEWATRPLDTAAVTAPPLGGRREWCDYSYETTGYGSVERSGLSVRRVTLVRPGDRAALRRHHHLVVAGRLHPVRGRKILARSLHVVDGAALRHAGERSSWLAVAHGVARSCATDDVVAEVAGGTLRRLLWSARHDLSSRDALVALHELAAATDALVAERSRFSMALAEHDIADVRLQARALAELRGEWDAGRVRAGPTSSS